MTKLNINLNEQKTKEKTVGIQCDLQITCINSNNDDNCPHAITCFIGKWLGLVIVLIMFFIYIGLIIGGIIIWTIPPIIMKNTTVDASPSPSDNFQIQSRTIWVAQPPEGQIDSLKTPIPLVVIHHTATLPCFSQSQCIYQIRYIQTFHMESNGWSDIGYNFMVGGDGLAYEGRGWTNAGAHTLGFNNQSLGVAVVGTFNKEVPPEKQIEALKKLLKRGVELEYLSKDYKIIAACQLSGTLSPGRAFYDILKSWDRWIKNAEDLKL